MLAGLGRGCAFAPAILMPCPIGQLTLFPIQHKYQTRATGFGSDLSAASRAGGNSTRSVLRFDSPLQTLEGRYTGTLDAHTDYTILQFGAFFKSQNSPALEKLPYSGRMKWVFGHT